MSMAVWRRNASLLAPYGIAVACVRFLSCGQPWQIVNELIPQRRHTKERKQGTHRPGRIGSRAWRPDILSCIWLLGLVPEQFRRGYMHDEAHVLRSAPRVWAFHLCL